MSREIHGYGLNALRSFINESPDSIRAAKNIKLLDDILTQLLESRDAALAEAAAHKAEVDRLFLALNEIATYGAKNTGHGYTCARIARAALAATPTAKEPTP